jgi:CRP-like cAMP-binding protein
MGSPHGLRIIQNPVASLACKEKMFCDSLASSLTMLDTVIPPVAYPKGAVLFTEGQTACGIFVVCSGQNILAKCLQASSKSVCQSERDDVNE